MFDLLRQDEAFVSYYEPLHPNLISHIHNLRDGYNLHPKATFFREYLSHLEALSEIFDPEFATNNAVFPQETNAGQLRHYLAYLAGSSANVIMQFNRAFWCADWLENVFPHAIFVHIVRDPRAVVWSQLTRQPIGRVALNLPLLGRRPAPSQGWVFSRCTDLSAYHVEEYLRVGKSSSNEETRNNLAAVSSERPYVQALALWGEQVRICHEQAIRSFASRYSLIKYEDLCADPQAVLSTIYGITGHDLPKNVKDFATNVVRSDRLAPWRQVRGADSSFERGIAKAKIGDLLDLVGYG